MGDFADLAAMVGERDAWRDRCEKAEREVNTLREMYAARELKVREALRTLSYRPWNNLGEEEARIAKLLAPHEYCGACHAARHQHDEHDHPFEPTGDYDQPELPTNDEPPAVERSHMCAVTAAHKNESEWLNGLVEAGRLWMCAPCGASHRLTFTRDSGGNVVANHWELELIDG